jgi:protein phosphatase inhibitor 2
MKWDEQNLTDNAVIQKEVLDGMGATRIEEPKTPYVNYEMPQDETGDLTLTESNADDHGFHFNEDDDIVPHEEALPSPREVASKTISPDAQMDHLQQAFKQKGDWDSEDEDMDGSDEDDEEHLTEEQLQKRRAFQEHRKQHYNEYEMMKKFREQHQNDDDDDE